MPLRSSPGHRSPKGADATVKYEITEFTNTEVRIFEPIAPNTDIVRAGDDIKAGALIAPCGTVVSAPLAGVLAGQGIAAVNVYRKPVIAIIKTGTELLEVGTPLRPAMIYNSNVYTLSGYLLEVGAAAKNAGRRRGRPGCHRRQNRRGAHERRYGDHNGRRVRGRLRLGLSASAQ